MHIYFQKLLRRTVMEIKTTQDADPLARFLLLADVQRTPGIVPDQEDMQTGCDSCAFTELLDLGGDLLLHTLSYPRAVDYRWHMTRPFWISSKAIWWTASKPSSR